jgi:hypothetical protein
MGFTLVNMPDVQGLCLARREVAHADMRSRPVTRDKIAGRALAGVSRLGAAPSCPANRAELLGMRLIYRGELCLVI